MTYYTLQSLEDLIDRYVNEHGGCMAQIEEGVLGLGTVMLYGAEGKKTIIITEEYRNEWSSVHKCRMWNKMPKKYEKYAV